jgi:putative membrane protein
MVAWGLWTWAKPGGYFGIPWQNYLGWLLAAALITVAVRPHELPTGPFMLIYVVTWLLEAIGLLFFWGLPGPALVGFVGMGSLIWLARQQRRN